MEFINIDNEHWLNPKDIIRIQILRKEHRFVVEFTMREKNESCKVFKFFPTREMAVRFVTQQIEQE